MLQLAIFDAPGGTLIADVSSAASSVQASTNAHGFATLTAAVNLSLAAAFALYDRPGLPHVVLSDGASIIFEGRLEDVAITDPGAKIDGARLLAGVERCAVYGGLERYQRGAVAARAAN